MQKMTDSTNVHAETSPPVEAHEVAITTTKSVTPVQATDKTPPSTQNSV
jgi:hypothetical protein